VRSAIGGGIIPLAMRGTLSHAFFSSMDWFPTLMHSAGLDDTNINFEGFQLSGHSMWDVLSTNNLTKMPQRTVWIGAICASNPNTCVHEVRWNSNWYLVNTPYQIEDAFYHIVPPKGDGDAPIYYKMVTGSKYAAEGRDYSMYGAANRVYGAYDQKCLPTDEMFGRQKEVNCFDGASSTFCQTPTK
jgi:hypothetical protein